VKISEQIKALLAARQEKLQLMESIQTKVAGESRNKDAKEQEEFDTASNELDAVDQELKDLRRLEKAQLVKATAVIADLPEDDDIDPEDPAATANPKKKGVQAQGGGARSLVAIPKQYAKGILFARFVKCMAVGRGDASVAYNFSKQYADTPQIGRVIKAIRDNSSRLADVLKTAVAGATPTDSTWAGPLMEYNQFAGDFLEFLRPQTIIGKFGAGGVPALRAVPFNIHIRGQTTGGQGYWVGAGKPKPLTKYDFNDTYLGFSKVATIAVLTDEIVRFSNPSAEALVRDALAGSLIERVDIDFIDPAKAAVSNVSPASITNGVTAIHSAGGTAADVRVDIAAAMTKFIHANISPTTAVWIMPATVALQLSLLRNAFGQAEFPGITMNGGTLEGVPVITSQYVPVDTAGATLILVNASDIWLADDGQVTIDASREASLQMLDNPTNSATDGTATSMVSMFQTDSIALRAERYINWQKRRAAAVVVVDQVNYDGT
jgi:hypothetical protein